MTKKQQAKLKMYDSVIGFSNKNSDTISAMPALRSAFELFRNTLTAIHDIAQQKALDIKNVAKNKNHLRAVLIKKVPGIAATVHAYARTINNIALQGQVNYKLSEIKALRDEELVLVSQNISNFANASLAGLAPYNITAATITELNAAIDQFRTALPDPRNALTERSQFVKGLKQLFVICDDILRNDLDNIIANLETTNPDFRSLYLRNRIIVDSYTTSTQIKIQITNGNTNKAVKGATITLQATGATGITNVSGKCTLKSVPNGTAIVTITKEGFEPVILSDVKVKYGQITKVAAVLKKIVEEKK